MKTERGYQEQIRALTSRIEAERRKRPVKPARRDCRAAKLTGLQANLDQAQAELAEMSNPA